MKNLILSLFLWCIFSLPAMAQTCKDYNNTLTIPEDIGSGTATITGQVCFTAADLSQPMTGSATVTFDNFSNSGEYNVNFSATGSFNFEYYANSIDPTPTEIRVKYMDGPVSYIVNNQTYEVYFNDLEYTLDAQGNQITATGSVTINGNTTEAANVNFGYVRMF